MVYYLKKNMRKQVPKKTDQGTPVQITKDISKEIVEAFAKYLPK